MNAINTKKLSIGILKLVLSLFVLLTVQTAVNAQYLNLVGNWEGYEADGTRSTYVWRIIQTDGALTFIDVGAGTNTRFSGQIAGRTITDSLGKTGTVSGDDSQIKWSDNIVWKKLNTNTPRIFSDGTKINLIADNGYRMTRCNGCQNTTGGISDTVILTSDGESQFSTFEVRNDPTGTGKISLKADTGNTVAYCKGCVTDETTPDNIVVETKFNANNTLSQFTLTRLANGKYTLKDANGKYLSRCYDCSPSLYRLTGKHRNVVSSHGTNPNDDFSQWTILTAGEPAPGPISIPNREVTFPRFSFDSNPYRQDTTKADTWIWNGGTERTIYNPLDGGVLLKYTMQSQSSSDGCSRGAPREKGIFQQACFAHDTNYDAPFPLAGFPAYPNGSSTGQEISDYLFYKDMQLINKKAKDANDGFTNWINDAAADLFYTGVVGFAHFRGKSAGKSIQAKGGVIAVLNDGFYSMTLKVTWTSPDGNARSAEVTKPTGQTAVVPLSVGATNITAEAKVDLVGKTIFTKNFSRPGMYAYTVAGTFASPNEQAGLQNNAKGIIAGGSDDIEDNDAREIKFTNSAWFDAQMNVTFYEYQDPNLSTEPQKKTFTTGFKNLGSTAYIKIPKQTAYNKPVTVSLVGSATVKNNIYSINLPGGFANSPRPCFTTWGSLFNPSGGKCDAADVNKTSYEFSIKTADESGAGTDSNIYIKICGQKGCTGEQQVNSKISGNAFERNQLDRFTMSDTDVGEITYIEIRSDMSYPGAEWKLEWITIATGSRISVFGGGKFDDTITRTHNVTGVR